MATFILISAYTLTAILHSIILGALILKAYRQTDLESEDYALVIISSIVWPISTPLILLPLMLGVVPNPINSLSKKLLNFFQKDK